MSNRDELAEVIASELNKQFKSHQVAYFLDGVGETPTDVTDWVSTGSTILDLAVSNRPDGGLAAGRITEINGLEGSGKSLIGAHALAATQRKGGLAVYIDTAAASTKVEMDADFDKDGWATSKAIVLSKAMRKITQMIARQKVCLIFTNQLRQKMGVMFGDPWTTSGGKALPFHASTRIRLKNMGQIKDTKKNTIGIKIRAQVIKNRLGPPLRSADFQLYFDKGIDDFGSWLTIMKDHKLVKQAGAWYTLVDQDGKEHKFQSKDFESLMADEETQKYVYDMICEKVILKYDSGKLGIDDVSTTDEFVDE